MPESTDPQPLQSIIDERARLHGLTISRDAVPALAVHLAMMIDWGKAVRLTAIQSREALVDRHILESVVAAGHAGADEGRYVDIGSGNGYPALPIKCLNPGLEATLLEPSLRKSIFLRHVIRAMALNGIEVRRERIEAPEDLKNYAPARVISMRAVAVLEEVLQGAGETLSAGGRVLLFLGAEKARAVRGRIPAGLRILDETPLPGRTRSCLVILQRI